MPKPFTKLLKKCPYIGIIEKWDIERGFGFICPDSEEITIDNPYQMRQRYGHRRRRLEFFVHISRRDGDKSRDLDLEGQRCLFAIGFHPKKKKRPTAILWITEEDIEGDINDYLNARKEALAFWDVQKLTAALKAKWYVKDIWRGVIPKSGLPKDKILLNTVEERLSNPQNPFDYYSLLNAKIESPFYTFTEDEKREELHKGLIRLVEEHPYVFQNFDSQKLSSFLSQVGSGFSDIFNPIGQRIFVEQAIAIDIESDGEELFQVGYAQGDQANLIEVNEGINTSTKSACQKLVSAVQSKWIVGHNLIEWDLPILIHNESSFSRNYGIWDTLLISTLLKPWKASHALSTSVIAHRADSDAEAALKLFKEQVNAIPLDYMEFIQNEEKLSPINLIEKCASAIQQSKDRKYPDPPSFLKNIPIKSSESPIIILPEILLSYCAWVPGIRYYWPKGYSNRVHFCLPANRIEKEIANSTGDNILHTLLLHILKDAEANNVQVLVQMLPYWLRAKCGDLIEKCAEISAEVPGQTKLRISTYEACHTRCESAEEVFNEGIKIFPEIGRLSLFEKIADLSTREIEKTIIPGYETELSYQLRRLTEAQSRNLCGADFIQDGSYWLEYHPTRKRLAKPWTIWHSRHLSSSEEQSSESITPELFSPDVFIRPRWLDENTGIQVGIDNIWPTSANRAAYWRDLVFQINSLYHSLESRSILIALLEKETELKIARSLFSELGYSLNEDSSIAQQVLAAKRGKKICAVDIFNNLAKWKQTAFELDCQVHFIIASVPLAQWLMCLSTSKDDTAIEETNGDFSGEDTVELKEEDDHINIVSERNERFPFTNEDVEEAITLFLTPWLKTYFNDDVPMILDPRLNLYTSKLKRLGRIEDVIWHPLEKEQSNILDRYKEEFGQIERKEPPTDYEAYEEFLDKHWRNQKDPKEKPWKFKEDTQKPAIEAICQAQSDLLVKLPTGEGKSVIFQVPALLMGLHTQRLTIVITPLRALMRDQVVSLWKKGFFTSVDYLSADREPWETSGVYQGILDNTIKLLYIAPERFRVSRFRDALDRRYHNDGGLEFVVIDETHCVSQWGFEFRPDYFYSLEEINRLYRSNSAPVRVLMFSATVTRAVEGDLRKILGHMESDSLLVRPESYRHPIQNHIRLKPEEVKVALYGEGREAKLIDRTCKIKHIIEEAKPDTKKSLVMVFVTRRDHAEAIATSLAKKLPEEFRIEYFHAGMPPNERLRVYESIKNCAKGGANVLVATKAFGMGMDIPNIHWCIHLAPPSFLEDYLQEVGRTGRGARERAAVELEHIECTLLNHPDDFSRNHELVRRNMIQPHELVLLWAEIVKRSAISSSGKRIGILPTDGYEEMKGDRLRRGLSWLERKPAKRLSILGYLPDMLKVTLKRDFLEQCAKIDDSKGAVAKALLRTFEPPSQADIQGSIWNFLKKFVGFVFASSAQPQVPDINHEPRIVEAEINLGAVQSQSKLSSADELYRALFTLQEASAITIEQELKFKKGSATDKSAIVWKWVDALINDLVGKAYEKGREVPPEEMMQIVFKAVELNEPITQKKRSLVESVVRAVIRLINASGLRIREQLNEERNLAYRYTLSDDRLKILNWRIKSHIKTAKELENLLGRIGENPVNLGELLKLLGTDRRLRDLRIALRLISDLLLYSSEQPLFCYSYILEISTTDTLSDRTASELKPSDREMYEQLEKVNRFSELRSFAMEMFARLSTDEERRRFIDDYFQAGTPEELEDLLGKTAGGIDDPNVPEAMKQLLTKVRQEAIQKALDRFRHGEEPEQYRVCSHPWNRNLLVNAGPGAGKTEVLMMRAAHLIHQQGLHPEQVLILAFNRAVVHEIKARIKRLFDELGYGAFVRRLKVRTFHSFALEHKNQGETFIRPKDYDLDTVVNEFSRKCVDNSDFARNVVAGIRAILVDEFQDMNDSRYGLLKALVKAANSDPLNPNTGIMVIGDDDQDILRWDRKDNPVEAREYFKNYIEDFKPVDIFNLKVNFRSSKIIVQRSQRFIDNVLSKVTSRMKTDIKLSARQDATTGKIDDKSNYPTESLVSMVTASRKASNTCALLCRTNYEACQLYEDLRKDVPGIQIQGRENLKLARLRHIGTWLDICCQLLDEKGNQTLGDELKGTIQNEYRKTNIPEVKNPTSMISFLWNSVMEENPRATLEYFIAFIEELRTDDYIRMLGKTKIPKWIEKCEKDGIGKTLVSTIHKVKGLEFDSLIILPSSANFPFNEENANLIIGSHQADEARLFYVAMTRAKRNLLFSLGPRENSWIEGKKYNGVPGGIYIKGSPAEIFIGWPGFDNNRQEYIRTQIKVGDDITLQNTRKSIALKHRDTRIGFLSKSVVNRISAASIGNTILQAQSIYRYPITDEVPEDILNKITEKCKNQGWIYTVLVTGMAH